MPPSSLYQGPVIPDPIYKYIGALIKARRKTLQLKQENLASMLGISRGALANIETGRQNVLVHQLYKYAAALQLTPFDLLPSSLTERSIGEHAELPLPNNLKAQQRKEIAHLLLQVDTNQTLKSEVSHAKNNKQ
jgi:transcriptional regulator with XRE-family HTH domain